MSKGEAQKAMTALTGQKSETKKPGNKEEMSEQAFQKKESSLPEVAIFGGANQKLITYTRKQDSQLKPQGATFYVAAIPGNSTYVVSDDLN